MHVCHYLCRVNAECSCLYINQAQREYKHSLTFHVLADISRSVLYCHSNETRAPIANPTNTAQLQGTPYHSSSYIWVCATVWECGEGRTNTQICVTNIYFASATPHVKCNNKCRNATAGP